MERYLRRGLYLLLGVVLILSFGCARVGVKDTRIDDMEERITQLEMLIGAGVGAKFYPARGTYGGAAGDLDKITGTVDSDVGMVVLHDDANLGDAVLFYILDVDSTCGEDDTSTIPLYFQAGDGGNECWELANVYALVNNSPMRAITDSSPGALDEDEVSNTYIYTTATGTFTLPEIGTLAEVQSTIDMVPEGSSFCVHTVGAIAITIDPHINNSITLDGTEDTDGDSVTNTSASGDVLCLVACDPNGWCAPSNPDSWTPN